MADRCTCQQMLALILLLAPRFAELAHVGQFRFAVPLLFGFLLAEIGRLLAFVLVVDFRFLLAWVLVFMNSSGFA